MTKPLRLTLVGLFFLLLPVSVYPQDDGVFTLTAESLRESKIVELDKLTWRYHAGDDAAWAAKNFDDAAWERLSTTTLKLDAMPQTGWNGAAWFRLRLNVVEELANRPLLLRLRHWGASEVYLDGKLAARFGEISANGEKEFNPRLLATPIVFDGGGAHTLAVRYSFQAERDLSGGMGSWLARHNFLPGFQLRLESADDSVLKQLQERPPRIAAALIGTLLALALLHFLLFAFYTRERGNLFYSLFVASFAFQILLSNVVLKGHQTAVVSMVLNILGGLTLGLSFVSLLAFIYVAFTPKFSKRFWALLAAWAIVVVARAFAPRLGAVFISTSVLIFLTFTDGISMMVRALKEHRKGAWIIMAGVQIFAIAMGLGLLQQLGILKLPVFVAELSEFAIFLSIPLSVSIFLARNFARTNVNLETQLRQVKDLSARQLELERTEAELRLKHEHERAENERRAKELEEARQIQLSMLPAKVPQLPNLDIAAYMKPATEVGGDYYDFHVGDDGTLTVAVGDATGHGLRAGTMVTATKSLFNTHAHEPDITRIFRQSSSALKRMNLRSLYMAMTMIKVKDSHLSVSAAGMPPMLIYRATTGSVEEVAIRGMPLGSVANFSYQQRELKMFAGDIVLLMSDGFPEMFNERDETLDYDKARTVLEEVAQRSPQEIINHFVQVGEKWAGTRAQDDDVTFVVLKVKDSNERFAEDESVCNR